jgi:hypothetical protein
MHLSAGFNLPPSIPLPYEGRGKDRSVEDEFEPRTPNPESRILVLARSTVQDEIVHTIRIIEIRIVACSRKVIPPDGAKWAETN